MVCGSQGFRGDVWVSAKTGQLSARAPGFWFRLLCQPVCLLPSVLLVASLHYLSLTKNFCFWKIFFLNYQTRCPLIWTLKVIGFIQVEINPVLLAPFRWSNSPTDMFHPNFLLTLVFSFFKPPPILHTTYENSGWLPIDARWSPIFLKQSPKSSLIRLQTPFTIRFPPLTQRDCGKTILHGPLTFLHFCTQRRWDIWLQSIFSRMCEGLENRDTNCLQSGGKLC